MINNSYSLKKKTQSLKTKLVIGFLIIIITVSLISIVSFFLLRTTITELDRMVEVTILANEINNIIGTPQKGLYFSARQYNQYLADNDKKAVIGEMDSIYGIINKLRKYIKDKDGVNSLDGVESITETITNNVWQILEKAPDKDKRDEVLQLFTETEENTVSILNLVRELIGVELNNQMKIKAELNRKTDTTGVVIIGLIILVSLISALGAIIFANRVVKPLKKVTETLKNITEGEGDLTRKIDVTSSDEIGLLSLQFNGFVSSLSNIIKRIKNAVVVTRDIGSSLASSTEESTTALEEIQRNIENMKNKTNFLDNEISESHKLANEAKGYILKMEDLMVSQSSAVSVSLKEIEGILASIKSMVQSSEAKYNVSQNLQEVAKSGEKMMEDTLKVIQKVSESASVIIELLKVINETASQTNILSMNASIEASHAGIYGKGFAIVAIEIKKLAENTASNSKRVNKSLNDLMEFMQVSENSMEQTSSFFQNIKTGISEVSEGITDSKNAIQGLSSGNEAIVQSLNTLVKVTEDVKNNYGIIDRTFQLITESLIKVNSISTETKIGMKEITEGIVEIHNSSREILNTGTNNVEKMIELEELVKKFKIKD